MCLEKVQNPPPPKKLLNVLEFHLMFFVSTVGVTHVRLSYHRRLCTCLLVHLLVDVGRLSGRHAALHAIVVAVEQDRMSGDLHVRQAACRLAGRLQGAVVDARVATGQRQRSQHGTTTHTQRHYESLRHPTAN